MKNKSVFSVWRRAPAIAGLTALLALPLTQVVHSADFAALAVVKPIRSCMDLQTLNIPRIVGRTGAIKSTDMVITDKGPFCKVSATVAPEIMITTYLPAEHWTQRYFQGRGGENPPDGFSEAATCQPALNGEFAYGLSNVRFTMVIGSTRGESPGFVPDPEKILDYSYRGNHVANQISKALIEAYYGQGPRYSYFVGCSDGGRQGLVEAQRFPDDFDGIGAGSPGIISTAQESTFHIWKVQANKRSDGTNILMPEKLTLLHNAVVAHCDTLSGVEDGILQDPNACHFDPAVMRCPVDSVRTTGCFTAEELTAIQKLYAGAHDEQGHYFYFGLPRGSESLWKLPPTATGEDPGIATHATQLAYILLPDVTPRAADYEKVIISKRDFEHASTRSPMFDAASTDLKPFAAHGGKLILWHGLNDVMIPARATMAYYDGVEKFMGRAATSQFLRAFYPPGVGHCGGGDGYTEIDILSALMNWVESKHAPTQIVAGKTATPVTTVGASGVIEPGVSKPYAAPQRELVAKRPLYPYPYIARYTGKGDPDNAANYTRAMSDAKPWPPYDYQAVTLIGPDTQRNYEVRSGRIQQVVGR